MLKERCKRAGGEGPLSDEGEEEDEGTDEKGAMELDRTHRKKHAEVKANTKSRDPQFATPAKKERDESKEQQQEQTQKKCHKRTVSTPLRVIVSGEAVVSPKSITPKGVPIARIHSSWFTCFCT